MSNNDITNKTEAENISTDAVSDSLATSEVDERNIKVSVIIPIFNACRYIRPALDSIISQTLTDIEIICVDDGSTDTSLDMIKIYQKLDSRIRIITKTNGGPALARNNGLARARGEYVAFLDADDFYEIDMLEKLYSRAKVDNLDIVIGNYDIYNNKKARFQQSVESDFGMIYKGGAVSSKNEYPDYILQSTTGAAWNKIFKRSFIESMGIIFLPDAMVFEDVYFTVAALSFAEKVARIDDVVMHHRVYSAQSRVRLFKKNYNQIPEVFVRIKEFLMRGGMYQPLSNGFLNLSASRCYHTFNLLKFDAKEKFFNLLHDEYCDKLGWIEHVAEDYHKSDVCEFIANVMMYTYGQYEKRNKKGMRLRRDKIDSKLKQNIRRKQIREFFAKIFSKKKGK